MSRIASVSRKTTETQVTVEVNLDGNGQYDLNTGNGMFDHLLAQLSRHGLIDLKISASGDVEVGWHHLVEDTAIVLGQAFKEAVGSGCGIARMGHSYVPLDESLALSVVDLGGRGFAVVDANLSDSDLGGLPSNLIFHFLDTLARQGGFNLHVRLLAGSNNHHKVEAMFKSLARALRVAIAIDDRVGGHIPSTKGTIG